MSVTASHAALVTLLLAILLAVLAYLLVRVLGRRLTALLTRLAAVTTNLPDTLLHHRALAGPYSLVTDIEALAGTLRAMVEILQRHVQESQRTNAMLERHVQERTQQLLEANAQLGKEILQRA
jgi:C4-dicarboxylate-specific signal transduction histidine kinase